MTDRDDEVFQAIVVALQPFCKPDTKVVAETDISQDLNLDSLAVMDLTLALEERFDVSIPLNLLPEVRTVGDLAATVRTLRGG